jgi:hypothetical protein
LLGLQQQNYLKKGKTALTKGEREKGRRQHN